MSNVKQVRGQIRQIVKEILPEILNAEQYDLLKKHVDARILEVEKMVKDTMSEMNNRHKDVMGYLVRGVSAPVAKK